VKLIQRVLKWKKAEEERQLSSNKRNHEIEEFQQKLSVLKEQRTRLNKEASEWAEKRDKFNEHVRNLRTEIRELRIKRDKLNVKVSELKQLREKSRTEIRERIEEINRANQQVTTLVKKKPLRSFQTLRKKMEEIEWQIQTTSISLQEEKDLVTQVTELQTQVNIYIRLETWHQKILESQAELTATKTTNRLHHKKLTEMAEKSQEIHNKMLEKINAIREYEKKADDMHQRFLQTRQKAKPIQEEMNKILGQIKLLKEEIRKEEEKEKKKREEALRSRIEKRAKEKLEQGQKLTWEEFQILTEKGKITQD